MKYFKSISFLFACLSLLTGKAYSNSTPHSQNPDTLYKWALQAGNVYTGINLAKQACTAAQLKNNKIVYIQGLNLLAKCFWKKGINDSAQVYGQYALLAAEKYHVDSLKSNAWMTLALADHSMGYYLAAIEKYETAIVFFKRYNKTSNVAKACLDIGICLQQLSKYNEAINYYLLAGTYFEGLKDDKNLANTYNSIALLFAALGNYPDAIVYNKKALVIRQQQQDKQLIAQSFNNIGVVFKDGHQLDSAIYYFSASIYLYEKEKDSSLLVMPLQNLSSVWRQKKDFPKAVQYIRHSLTIATKYRMNIEIAQGNLALARLYMQQNKFKLALAAINTTEQTAIRLKITGLLMETYDVKYNLFVSENDYKQALFFYNKRDKIKDSLFTVAKNRAISELAIKYQINETRKDVATLHVQNALEQKVVKQQKFSIIVLIIAAVLLLLLFIIAYNNFRLKHRKNIRIQTLMQDLHHRVKNNLQILSGLFAMQMESLNDEAARNTLRENELRLMAMNLIHNKLYIDNTTTQIEVQEYLTQLLHHVKDSFGGNSHITLRMEIDYILLDADKAVALGLIVNELACNAFKYAFTDITEGEIYLALKKQDRSRLLLTLSDTGKGITAVHKENSQSFGLKLVNLLTRQLNSTLHIKSDKGVCYQMEIGV